MPEFDQQGQIGQCIRTTDTDPARKRGQGGQCQKKGGDKRSQRMGKGSGGCQGRRQEPAGLDLIGWDQYGKTQKRALTEKA